MTTHYEFNPHGVCCRKMEVDITDGLIRNAKFHYGCDGNLKAMAKLCEGQRPQWVIERLKGNTCGPKPTSCADQFAKMLELVLKEEEKQQAAAQ